MQVLHLSATMVYMLGVLAEGRCTSISVLAALVSGSSCPSLGCSSTSLPNATARMLSIVKKPKYLIKITGRSDYVTHDTSLQATGYFITVLYFKGCLIW